jgi:predicted amidohydrolase
MDVAVLELPARWGAPAEALADVDERLARGPAADLVLLPEASLTGYLSPDGDTDLGPAAEPVDGPTARALAGLAVRHRTHVVGPLVEADGERRFNAIVGFGPDGSRVLHYRKRHPWMPETWATPGDLPYPLVEIGGLRVTLAVCYDLHFIPAEAADQLSAADLLLFPSAWVERRDTRVGRLRRLAERFGVAVANANWGAGVVNVYGQQGSCIVGSDGTVLAVASLNGRADATVRRR